MKDIMKRNVARPEFNYTKSDFNAYLVHYHIIIRIALKLRLNVPTSNLTFSIPPLAFCPVYHSELVKTVQL